MGCSTLEYYNGRYKGKLTDDTCMQLEALLDLKESNGFVSDLSHIVYELPESIIDSILESYSTFGEVLTEYDRSKYMGTLRDYQTIGVAFMYIAGDCILGDSVGMGKTVETSGLMNLLRRDFEVRGDRPHRFLVVTEKKPVVQVNREIIKYTGEFAHLIPNAEAKSIKNFTLDEPFDEDLRYSVVGTHALLKSPAFISWVEQYKQYHKRPPFDTLVVDESSVLGGSTTQMVKTFKVIRKYFTRLVFLNATPLETSLSIMYNQLDLLDNKFLPTKANFQKEYCVMDYSGMFPRLTNKYKNKEQFKHSIAYRYYASTRKDNGAIMEDCSGGIVLSDLSFEQKRLLKESQLTQMIYDCPSYIDSNIPFDTVNVPKLASLESVLNDKCKDADSIIIYVHFREAQEHISKWLTSKGIPNRVLNGATDKRIVNDTIDGFKNNEFKVLITNVQKGLNFGNCNYCIFYSILNRPAEMVQFEGRMTRGFNIYDKHVYMLCSKGREFNNLRSVAKDRAEAMESMTTTDYSVVLDILSKLVRK